MIVSGKKIKEYREKRSMTKAELSKNAGVPYDTLMSWEMERRIPRDVSLVAQVSRELGVSIEDLIDGSGTSNFSDSDNVKYQHKDDRELLGDLDDFLESWTIHRNEFILLFGADGMDAAQIAEEEQFDLVLLDLMLPGKSGYQICREIRDKLDIPILMVTARTESVDKVRGLGLGVNANLRQYQRMVEKFANKGPDASEEIQVQDLRIRAGWDRNIRKCCKFGWNRTYTDKKGPQYPGLA